MDDPDAIWKPGFTGEVVWSRPDRVAPRAPRRRARRLGAGIGLALTAAVGTTLALTLRGGTERAASSSVERIPTSAETRWSANVPGWVDAVAGSHDLVIATSSSGRPAITALDGTDGRRLWTEPSPGGAIGSLSVVGGVVVYSHGDRSAGAAIELVGLDARSGVRRWRRPLPQPGAVWMDGRRVIVPRLDIDGSIVGLDLIDPSTGSTRASITGGGLQFSDQVVERRDGDSFDVFDLATFTRVTHVTVAGLGDRAASVVPTAAGALVVTGTEARLLDAGGATEAARAVPGGRRADIPVTWALGDTVVVQAGGTLTAFDVGERHIGVLWTRRGALLDHDRDGALLAVRPVDGAMGPGHQLADSVLDARTGATVWTGTMSIPTGATGLDLMGINGFLADVPGPDRTQRTIAGVAIDGSTRWRHAVRRGATAVLVDGAVIEFGPQNGRLDETTVTLLR